MLGFVDDGGRAIIEISIARAAGEPFTPLNAWIDTGCTVELVLPEGVVASLGLMPSSYSKVVLGDGSQVTLPSYSCLIDWFGRQKQVEVRLKDEGFPLIGVGLLLALELRVDYRNLAVQLGPVPRVQSPCDA